MEEFLHFDSKLLVALIALSVGAFGAYLALKSFRRNFIKKLSYKIVTDSILIGNLSDEIKQNVEILYKDYKVNNVSFIELNIYNSGFKAIEINDFNEQIHIKLNREAHILQYNVSKCKPNNLKVQLSKNHSELFVEPILLNSKDTFNIEMIVSDYKNLIIESRIKDIKGILNESVNKKKYSNLIYFLHDFQILLSGLLISLIFSRSIPIEIGENLLIVLLILYLFVQILRAFLETRKDK